ncbi:MAG: tRNA lysidine(34) synthetase TilS [Blautia sp.]
MEKQVFSYIERYNMIETGDRVIVGVSGGADSVCLLFLLREYKKIKDFALEAVHVNHQIRQEEAKRDERFVKELCRSIQVPCTIYSYPVPKIAGEKHMTEEEAGRIMRQQAFRTCMLQGKQGKTALAHHRDDLAETMIHNLVRGSGISGMAGIRPVTEINQLCVIRPLLETGKETMKAWLRNRQISWVEDSTNEELSYTRNRIRHKIIPELTGINPNAVAHMAGAAETFLLAEEYIGSQADMLYNRYVEREENAMEIKRGLFDEHRLLQAYVIQKVLEELSGQKKDITKIHIEAVKKLAAGRTGSRVSLAYGITAWQNYGNVRLAKGRLVPKGVRELEIEIFSRENQQIREKKYTKWFDYDKIKETLCVRQRKTGDFLTVTQEGGKKKLKDYFIDCKIPREERDSITLLADGSHILWVVGYRISEYYKVSTGTKRVIRVHVKGENEDE